MAVDKLVDSTQLDSDLTDVADEIRTAGGTLLPLSFPDDYVVAIGDIGNTEIKTVSGSIAHFEDALARKAQDLTVAIEPVQSGSGDPSPDNIRPISGWTGANVTRTGRNLLDTKNYAPSATTSSGITIVQNQDGSFNVSGTATGIVNLWLRGAYGGTNPVLKLYAGKTYFIKDVMLYRGTSQISPTIYIGAFGTYTPSADIEVTGIRASTPNGTTLDTTIYPYLTDSADTEWQEFGDTYSITFPSEAGTVYGGTLDVTTGKLTVTHKEITFDGSSDEQWSVIAGSNRAYIAVSDIDTSTPNGEVGDIISNQYMARAYSAPLADSITLRYGIAQINVFDIERIVSTVTIANWRDMLAANPLQVVYLLATPIVYDLDPVTVTTLLAQNNVWADTGDSTIKYIAPKAQIPSAQGVYF